MTAFHNHKTNESTGHDHAHWVIVSALNEVTRGIIAVYKASGYPTPPSPLYTLPPANQRATCGQFVQKGVSTLSANVKETPSSTSQYSHLLIALESNPTA